MSIGVPPLPAEVQDGGQRPGAAAAGSSLFARPGHHVGQPENDPKPDHDEKRHHTLHSIHGLFHTNNGSRENRCRHQMNAKADWKGCEKLPAVRCLSAR